MTKREGIAVNVVLTYMLGQKRALDALGIKPKVETDVAGSAALLAYKAHQTLAAGLDSEIVLKIWGDAGKAQALLARAGRPN